MTNEEKARLIEMVCGGCVVRISEVKATLGWKGRITDVAAKLKDELKDDAQFTVMQQGRVWILEYQRTLEPDPTTKTDSEREDIPFDSAENKPETETREVKYQRAEVIIKPDAIQNAILNTVDAKPRITTLPLYSRVCVSLGINNQSIFKQFNVELNKLLEDNRIMHTSGTGFTRKWMTAQNETKNLNFKSFWKGGGKSLSKTMLRMAREELGYSSADLAAYVDIRVEYLDCVENRIRPVEHSVCKRLLNALGGELEDFFTPEG